MRLGLRMIRGEVISFDRVKGYGFVAPEAGGEDVFIHVNDLYSDKSLLSAGCIVEFRLEEGDRGPKASEVTVVQPAAGAQVEAVERASGEGPRDVLAAGDFEHEVTEALLRVEPELTARQVLDIRKRVLRIAQQRGWNDPRG